MDFEPDVYGASILRFNEVGLVIDRFACPRHSIHRNETESIRFEKLGVHLRYLP